MAKLKKNKYNKVERLRGILEREKRDCEKSNCSFPPIHRLFKVGDRVNIGNLKWNKILEVCDN